MNIKELTTRIPPWGWIAGGGILIVGAFLLFRSSGSTGTISGSTGASDALQGLQDSIGQLVANGTSDTPTNTPVTTPVSPGPGIPVAGPYIPNPTSPTSGTGAIGVAGPYRGPIHVIGGTSISIPKQVSNTPVMVSKGSIRTTWQRI